MYGDVSYEDVLYRNILSLYQQDKLVNRAEVLHDETEDKSKDKLAEINEEIPNNKGCV
jgi:hypothetical protein